MRKTTTMAMTILATAIAGCASVPGTPRENAMATADGAAPTATRHDAKASTLASGEDADPAPGRAVPSPKEIFDFRPPGSKPDAWRTPFVIDTDDGPLRDEMRRSNAEMRKFHAEQEKEAKRPKDAGAVIKADDAKCGERAMAGGKPGCPRAAPVRKAPAAAGRDPLAIDR